MPIRARSVRRLLAATAATAAVAVMPILAPAPSSAAPAQAEPPDGDGATTGPASSHEDVLRASTADVSTSLSDRSADVQAQLDAVTSAQAAAAEADATLAAADAAVAATEQQISALTDQTDQVVVDTFVNPPMEHAFETLATPTLAESTVRQSIVDRQTDHNVEVLDQLEAAQAQLAEQQQTQEDAAAAAETAAADAATARDDLVSSLSAEASFVFLVQERLAARGAEAAALDGIDPAAAEALRAREGEIATTLAGIVSTREQQAAQAAMQQALADAAARAAASRASSSSSGSSSGGRTLGPASGNLASVSCPGGGSITVDSSVSGSLGSMLDAAAADGLNLCGGGYRDPSEQIALRRANCGTSDYAIYEAPSSSCSPPTAPPGTSNHEQGTAVDFTCNGGGTLSRSSPCFSWLRSNAAGYGFYNLPSEPWHWSVDGT